MGQDVPLSTFLYVHALISVMTFSCRKHCNDDDDDDDDDDIFSSCALSPPCVRDGETMVLVSKDDVVKLKTPQLNAVLYLKGASWGPSVGTAPEKRETVWRLLSGNSTADAVPVSDTLWNTVV